MTGLAARLRPAGATGSFDRRLIAPMVLGAILNPVNSSMIEVSLVPIGVAFGAPPTGTDSPGGILTLLAVSSQTIAVVGPTLGGLHGPAPAGGVHPRGLGAAAGRLAGRPLAVADLS